MVNYQNSKVILRAIEPQDLDFLYEIENEIDQWKYSDRIHPFSKSLLMSYISNSNKSIFETNQIKFTIINHLKKTIGFLDLFDFDPKNHRAAIGLIIIPSQRNKGMGSAAVDLVESYAREQLQLHQLYAHIADENYFSIKLFESQKFKLTGKKNDWNFYDGKYHDEFIYQKLI